MFGTAAAGTLQWPFSLLTSAEVFVYSLGSHRDSFHREGVCFPMESCSLALEDQEKSLNTLEVLAETSRFPAEYPSCTESSFLSSSDHVWFVSRFLDLDLSVSAWRNRKHGASRASTYSTPLGTMVHERMFGVHSFKQDFNPESHSKGGGSEQSCQWEVVCNTGF